MPQIQEAVITIPDEFQLTEQEWEAIRDPYYNRIAHEGLVRYANNTVHGKRFTIREFDPNIAHMLLENAHIPGVVDAEKTEKSLDTARFLVKNFSDFSAAIGESYCSEPIVSHRGGGGILLVVDNHITYESEPSIAMALTDQRLEDGEDLAGIIASQNIVAGRLIGTFALDTLRIVEDILLANGDLLQTFPPTNSGDVLPKLVRGAAIKLFKSEQYKKLRTPKNISIANLSGKQEKLIGKTYRMQGIHPRTTELYASLDANGGPDILVLPVFVRSESLDSGHRDVMDFAIGDTVKLTKPGDIHDIQEYIAELGNDALAKSHREDRRGLRVVYPRSNRKH